MVGEVRRLRSSTSWLTSTSCGFVLLKESNIRSRTDSVDDESADELDPDRICVPDFVVEESCEQSAIHDNQRPSEFHAAHNTPTPRAVTIGIRLLS
jgi:hypothetical protein